MKSTRPSDPTSLLHTLRYGLFWVSSLFSNIGTWMQQVAQPWVVLSLTGSSFWVGLDGFALNAPSWLFTLWGGVLADRFDRKRIILVFQGIQFLAVLALLALFASGRLRIWEVVAISFVVGSTDALSMPAFQSVIPSLVAKEELPQAIALNSTQFNLSRILGPALGGLLLTAWGAKVCFGANLVSYLPFFLSVYWIYPKDWPKGQVDHGVEEAGGGGRRYLSILRDAKFSVPLAIVFISGAFCSPLIGFCSVIVKNAFHAGSRELGWSSAAFGVGGVIGALSLTRAIAAFPRPQRLAGGAAVFMGCLTALVSWAPSLVALDVLMLLGGAALTITNTSVNSALQGAAHRSTRGRVVSLFQLTLHGGISAGSLLTGFISSRYGIRSALLVNGVIAVCLQLGVLIFAKEPAQD